ncbi:MAG: hypothetical protein AAB223_01520, partial [Pseudomonadota bacterium]
MLLARLAVFVFALVATALPGVSASAAEGPARPAAATIGWERELAAAERYVRAGLHDETTARRHRDALKRVQEEAGAAKAAAEREVKTAQDLLEALGPAPPKEGPRENAEVAAKRRQYT